MEQFKVKVHIVEDDPGVNESLRFLLQELGCTVHSHSSAFSFFIATPPDAGELVIVDLGLPDIEGACVIRWITRLSDAPRVVAITGQSHRLIEQAMKGFDNLLVLRKPLNGDSLLPLLS